MSKFNPETGAEINDRTSYINPSGERVTRADVARAIQAEIDRKSLEEIRCPYCDETRGHALESTDGTLRDCRGWALDDDAIRRGHPNRAAVVAEHRNTGQRFDLDDLGRLVRA